MAHTQGTTGRVQRLTSLVAMLAVAAAIALAFGRVFEGGGVTRTLLITGAATAIVAWALERRSLFLTTLAEIGVLIVVLGLLVFRDATWHLLPSLETLRAIGDAAGQVGEQARLQAAPAPPVVPLVFATVAAVWAAVFSCHALAFRAGSPLLALIPPGALIVFADSVLDDSVRPIYGLWFLLAALAVLFADSLRRMQGWGPVWGGPGRSDRMVPGAGRNARSVAAAAIAVAVVAPFIVPGFGGRAVFDITGVGPDGVNVSALVSMASQLNSDDPKDVFEVRSDVASYWRMTALERFDGVEWTPNESASTIPIDAASTLPGLSGGTPSTQTFTLVEDMLFPWLPSTYQPTSVDVPSEADWDPDTQTVLLRDQLHEGDTYTVTSAYVQPTPEDLRVSETIEDADPELTALPPAMPADITTIAEGITAGLTTDYDKVMAIQDFFTSTGGFTYDPDVAFREDMDTIHEFLTVNPRGFCQQFATAMAVLLRSIGIPARIAVGFTRGDTLPGGGGWEVSTQDLHSWVEVPFEGYGWLSFEPTARGRDDPIAGSYNDPISDPECRGRSCVDNNGPSTTLPPRDPSDIPGVDDVFTGELTRMSTAERITRTYGPWVVGIVIALIATWLILRWRRRRRALSLAHAAPRDSIVSTYRTFTKRAGAAGTARMPGETPEDYRTRLTVLLEDPEPLDRLTDLTVQAAYAPGEPTTDEALDALADADGALRELKRVSRRGRRATSEAER